MATSASLAMNARMLQVVAHPVSLDQHKLLIH
jgi:hypothetical protein